MMQIKSRIKRALLNDRNVERNTFFWNAFSSVMNSFQTMVLLLVITRRGNLDDSGVFVMAYAVGNLMLHIGKYGVRQFQVTDVNEKYCFAEYKKARNVSLIIMLLATTIWLGVNFALNQYSLKKIVVIFLICLLKGIEAYEDVFHGRMQQEGRLDVAGRILGIRLFLFIMGFTVLYVFSGNLLVTCVINVLASALLSWFLNALVLENFKIGEGVAGGNHWIHILRECFPLCLCMCLNMYNANAPKYTIDSMVSNDVQTCFNIVFMPVFVIALLGNFIFQPYLKRFGELWEESATGKLAKLITKLTVVVIWVDIVVTFVGSYIGTTILGAIYGVNLSEYRSELIIFMVAGGVVALQNLFIMAVTTVRYQMYMIYGYIAASMLMVTMGRNILIIYGLIGLSIFFLICMALICLYCVILISIAFHNRERYRGQKRK